ncbi:hypothetical protein BU25DRAFT_463806 [Macroventuria anomochaeta]|uniref:Uncharacterized protein n=1 Tax=Macroventuria anomochaeta TaxID=301207 RepID=A0ACB6RHT9_9PLEO|nr:uncharacterized protein BU25DRAFT_463806 [Macroventuria anomochaeta]KAF2621313.1 hypothetical protein BU25DRAFT_463806 [Macroventuria anomochaeta]
MSNYHPAFSPQHVRWSPSQGQFIAHPTQQHTAVALPNRTTLDVPSRPGPRPRPGLIDEMKFWENAFPAAMQQLANTPEPQYGTKLQDQWSIRRTKTWANVQAKLEMAHRDYNFSFQGQHTQRFRQTMRRVADKVAPYLSQGLKVVPDSEFTRPVINVLGFVLDAYQKACEVRGMVEAGFDDIPVAFAKVEFYHHSFQGDENIIQASVNLVEATLKAVEGSVKYYVSAQVKHLGKAVTKGDNYQQDLLEALQDMQARSIALSNQAEMSFQYHMMANGDQARQSMWDMQQTLGRIETNNVYFAGLFNHALDLFNQGVWFPHSPASSRSTTPNPPMLPQHVQWSTDYLRSQMYIPDIDIVDLQQVFHSDADLMLEDRGRAQQVLSSPLFRDWLLGSGSTKLLVHGDFDTTNRVTPFSALCATLTQAFRMTPGNIGLIFFCGSHLLGDEYSGGVWMIRSLVAQLLHQYSQPFIDSDAGIDMDQVARGDMPALCALFDVLVRQLPSATTILCIIDSINEYEDKEYLQKVEDIILTLLNLVDERSRGGARIKLLFASPQPTTEVRKIFDVEPGTLLHMQQLPLTGESMHSSALQERLESEVMYNS